MKILFIGTLNQSLPHTSSTAQTMIQGVRPFHISAVVTFSVEEAGLAGMVARRVVAAAQRRRQPERLGLPDLEEADQASHRHQ